jgi:hypothetical protein
MMPVRFVNWRSGGLRIFLLLKSGFLLHTFVWLAAAIGLLIWVPWSWYLKGFLLFVLIVGTPALTDVTMSYEKYRQLKAARGRNSSGR